MFVSRVGSTKVVGSNSTPVPSDAASVFVAVLLPDPPPHDVSAVISATATPTTSSG